jgi:CAAX protease family protein
MLSEKPWRADKVFQLGIAQLVCLCFGVFIAGVLHEIGVKGFKVEGGFGFTLVGTLSFQGAACLLMILFLRQHQIAWADALGLHGPARGRALVLAVAVAALILPVAWLLQSASFVALEKLGMNPSTQYAVKLLEDSRSIGEQIYLGLFTIVAAPVAEEFIFRGVLYPFLKRLGYPRLALWGVSSAFALVHVDVARFLPLLALALALTWLYERTDNLLAPIAAHSLFNATNFALFFLDSVSRSPVPK